MKRSFIVALSALLLLTLMTACGSGKDKGPKVAHGELISLEENDGVAVMKVKIKPSHDNEATINQNYYNVEEFVQKQNGDQYDEIQYWAVADMSNGNESKVISFTLDKETITALKEKKIFANQLGDYVTDLWILPSLKQ